MLQMKAMAGERLPFLFLVVAFIAASEGSLIRVLPMEDYMKDEWVESHNYYRRLVSDPEAADMRLMTWDDELADLARKVVSTCSFAHTSPGDLSTSAFPEAGENLFSGGLYRFSEMSRLEGITKGWYDEVAHYNYSSRSCDAGEVCGHYTQVVWANTYKMGCAVASCGSVAGGSAPYLVSCNYGPAGNIYTYGTALSPYTAGDSCSQCDGGDGCIDQLCNNTARDIPFTTTTTAASTTTTLQQTTATSTTGTPQEISTTVTTTFEEVTTATTSSDITTAATTATIAGAAASTDATNVITSTTSTEVATAANITASTEVVTTAGSAVSTDGANVAIDTTSPEVATTAYATASTDSSNVTCIRGTCTTTSTSTTSGGGPLSVANIIIMSIALVAFVGLTFLFGIF